MVATRRAESPARGSKRASSPGGRKGSQQATKSTALYMHLVYNGIGMLPFLLQPGEMVKTSWPGAKTEDCPRRGPCTETLEFAVGKVLLQALFACAMCFACVIGLPGKQGLLGSLGCGALIVLKLAFVEGIQPTTLSVVMTAGSAAAILYLPEEVGKRAYMAVCVFEAAMCVFSPLMVLRDMFPEVADGSSEYKLGAFCLEVVALYALMSAIVVATRDRALGLAYASQLGLTVLAKHVLLDHSGPLPPLVAFYVATTAMSWYEVGWTDLKPAAERAVKAGPMKVSASLAYATSAIMLLDTMGLSLPYVGMVALDSSFSYSGSSVLLTGSLTAWLAGYGYELSGGKMEGKHYACLHYFFSSLVLFWQFHPTTTESGSLVMCITHVLTAWTIYAIHSP